MLAGIDSGLAASDTIERNTFRYRALNGTPLLRLQKALITFTAK